MKAKVTGVSAWQGTPTGGTLSIRVPRYVDSSGNATVEEYIGWLDVNHTPPRWMDGIDHTRELYVIVQGPDDPPGVRGHFYEVLEYGPTKAVRTEFSRKMISSDLDGLIFDYAAPEPTEIPVGFGDAPLTMRAAQQVIEEGGAVVSEWSDIKVDIAQSIQQSQTEVDRLRLVNNVGAADIALLLRQWTQAEAYEPTAITRNADGLVTTATVKWPDGSAGTLTATNYNATHGVYDGFTITHATGKTITQSAVTRDNNGAVTVKPALTVTP